MAATTQTRLSFTCDGHEKKNFFWSGLPASGGTAHRLDIIEAKAGSDGDATARVVAEAGYLIPVAGIHWGERLFKRSVRAELRGATEER